MHFTYSVLQSPEFESSLTSLSNLLKSCVDSGASLGFLAGSDQSEFEQFWKEEFSAAFAGRNKIIAARHLDQIVGVVCLTSIGKATHSHRAEVRKLLVDNDFRGQGVAMALMTVLDEVAISEGKHLLTLDTETGSSADFLYQKLKWIRYGIIPKYAASPDGSLADCSFYFKQI